MAAETKATPDQLERLQRLRLKIQSLREVVRDNRLHFYKPIGAQPDFHAAGDAEIRLVLGGNQSGKTVCGVNEAIAHSLGVRSWLPKDDPNYIVRLPGGDPIPIPNIGRVVANSFEANIVQTIHPKFMEWAPKGSFKVIRNQRSVPTRYEWKNGSVTHLMVYEQEDSVFEGTTGHWFWCDEPSPQPKFDGLKRGLIAANGHCWMTMTPLAEPWINDVIVNNAEDPDGRIKLFNYPIWQNCIDNGGHLSRKAIEGFLKDLPKDVRKAREGGEFLHLAGRVFSEWVPRSPYWVEPQQIPKHWPRVCVVDPHPRKPIAVLWAAVSPDEQWHVYRELFTDELQTIHQVSDRIKQLEGWQELKGRYPGDPPTYFQSDQAEDIVLRIIDTSANATDRTSGESVAERFAAEDLGMIDAYKANKEAGLDAITEALRLPYEHSQPGLIVYNTCPTVKQNFMNYVWERWTSSRMQGTKGEKQQAVKNYDDMIDCIRYIFQMRLTYSNLKTMGRNNPERGAEVDEGDGFRGYRDPYPKRPTQDNFKRRQHGRRIYG